MTIATMNGRSRKSLADQIDRLDSILDGLADNLNDAVATAAINGVKDVVAFAVQEGVHTALIEVLSNPELRKQMAAQDRVPTDPIASIGQTTLSSLGWLAGATRTTCSRIATIAKAAGARVKEMLAPLFVSATVKVKETRERGVRHLRTCWGWVVTLAPLVHRFRTQLLTAAGIGVLVGTGCYLCGREIASITCGVAGFLGSLAVTAVNKLWRTSPLVTHREP